VVTLRSVKCDLCGKVVLRKEGFACYKRFKTHFCSDDCRIKFGRKKEKVSCKNCGKEFEKQPNQIKTTKNNFCSSSCAAIYNNAHRSTGVRRSKLEIWLELKLRELYPNEEILFNDKTAINSELDIYFPRLKLAFELNGIFHYEPIYGKEKLTQIQNNDQRKFLLCQQNNISLCIIDTSKEKYFKEERSKKYLDIIQKILVR